MATAISTGNNQITVEIRSPRGGLIDKGSVPEPIFVPPNATGPRINFALTISPNYHTSLVQSFTKWTVAFLLVVNCILPWVTPITHLGRLIITTLALFLVSASAAGIPNPTRRYQVFLNQGGHQTQPMDVDVSAATGGTI